MTEFVKKKLKRNNGESLTETLAAVIIICLGMVMLPGAVVSAARVNKAVESQSTLLDNAYKNEEANLATVMVTLGSGESASTLSKKCKVYRYGTDEKSAKAGDLYMYVTSNEESAGEGQGSEDGGGSEEESSGTDD